MKYGVGKDLLKVSPLFRENFNVALRSIKTNRLRSVLTIAIIAVGITSLVGILTAIETLRSSLDDSFGQMGANSFYILSKYSESSTSKKKRIKNRRNISYSQAISFAQNYDVESIATVYCNARHNEVVEYGSNKTNPTTRLVAVDSDYIRFNMGELEQGRNISSGDISSASFVCIIGSGVAKTLFKGGSPIDEVISLNYGRYRVVGLLEHVGQSGGASLDNSILIPITNTRLSMVNEDSFFSIGVMPALGVNTQYAIDEAEKIFRGVRRLKPYDESDFRIMRNDAMLGAMDEIMSILTIAAVAIGFITLLGAAVGLMNIMLVSVKERTNEIGTRKALGATSKLIKQQFLIESIIIGQLGGLSGIVMGVTIGNLIAFALDAPFAIPWGWIFIAVLVCLLVSVLSGYIPAKRAAALDPIESLRYE